MSFARRSLGAAAFFTALVLLAWLGPGPSEEFDVGGSTAYAAAAKKKASGAKASAATAKHRVHVKAALRKLNAAKRDLNQTRVAYGSHREHAMQHIDAARRNLIALERFLHQPKK